MSEVVRPREAPVLEVRGLSKEYGERLAVRNISFEIRSGEIFGLLGPNGAGKTTTIGMVTTVVKPSQGEIRLKGRSIQGFPVEERSSVGLVPQSLCVYPTLTAEENLRFFGRMYRLEGRDLSNRVASLLDFIGLTSRRKDRVESFSGGMKRRLNLACGLVHRPCLLLLDEPTVGVDPQSRERIFTMVEGLAAEGMALLYTTHYMEEAERLCRRVAIMDQGTIVAEGGVFELARLVEGRRFVRVVLDKHPSSQLLDRLRGTGTRQIGPEEFHIPEESIKDLLPEVLAGSSMEGNGIRELVLRRADLGEVFLHLTGKELRD